MTQENRSYLFKNREDAAQKLLDSLPVDSFQQRDTVVVAISPGGIIIADIIAKKLGVNMQVLISESLLAPKNDELVIAMVSETQKVVVNKAFVDSFDIDKTWVYEEAGRLHDTKITRVKKLCRDSKDIAGIKNKVILLVDECVETDMTALLAIKSMISLEAKNVYLAMPVLDRFSYESLLKISDDIFSPFIISDYISQEYYYESLPPHKIKELKRIVKSYE